MAEALTGMGVPADRAEPLATPLISGLEGASLIARTERDMRTLQTVAREFGPLLDSCAQRRSPRG
ncbi:hypothetical protein VXC91_39015 [Streptomyces chiangmaiensis]|uniref:Transcriptional regulator LmrA/YxaF-like C-terminal domain-containing protein n=1 Tax=Streptomyces chiangmaiensis TaxID=766497 RepID=A0ABU7FUJ3_9ACTN|nr:hypothetical protein [Streptomyces chiangmaiensis]MED7827727.1 hypothetical protein [Streptomyces chiangmaiensis]